MKKNNNNNNNKKYNNNKNNYDNQKDSKKPINYSENNFPSLNSTTQANSTIQIKTNTNKINYEKLKLEPSKDIIHQSNLDKKQNNKFVYVSYGKNKSIKIKDVEKYMQIVEEYNMVNEENDIYSGIVNLISRWQKHRDELNELLKEESPYYDEDSLWDIEYGDENEDDEELLSDDDDDDENYDNNYDVYDDY